MRKKGKRQKRSFLIKSDLWGDSEGRNTNRPAAHLNFPKYLFFSESNFH